MDIKYPERIKSARIRITGSDGNPVAGSEIRVRQSSSSLMVGCAAFETIPLVCGELEGEAREHTQTRIDKVLDMFNFVTLPFYWGRYEPERGRHDTERTLKTAKWLQERGMAVKGHPLCWHTVCAPWLLELSDEEILKTQLDRITRDVGAFKGVIDIWDVINEVVIMPIFDRYDNGVTRICKREGRVGLVKQVFKAARDANPGATLLINDFDMSKSYSALISGLLDAGIPIDAIGLQSHMHQGVWSAEKTEEILERFSMFGLPLHFTEINMVSGDLMPAHIVDLNDFVPEDWPTTPEGEARQAEDLTRFYRSLFKCPLVEAITYWSFTDGGWLNAPAGLMTRDARAKPSCVAIEKLIKEEWRTPELCVRSDDNGFIEVSGYGGGYAAEFAGGTMEFDI